MSRAAFCPDCGIRLRASEAEIATRCVMCRAGSTPGGDDRLPSMSRARTYGSRLTHPEPLLAIAPDLGPVLPWGAPATDEWQAAVAWERSPDRWGEVAR